MRFSLFGYFVNSPFSMARVVKADTLCMSSFCMRLARCFSTVFTLMQRKSAISLFLYPSAMELKIPRSRAVRVSQGVEAFWAFWFPDTLR